MYLIGIHCRQCIVIMIRIMHYISVSTRTNDIQFGFFAVGLPDRIHCIRRFFKIVQFIEFGFLTP